MGPGNLFHSSDGAVTSGGADALSYVAIGDSFTEGMNDRLPGGGFQGWADRLAANMAAGHPDLRYANLAIRGKLLRQILREQVPAAIDLLAGAGSDGVRLVSLAGGGNDIIRPGGDPDTLAELFDAGVARLRGAGCQVLMFTGFDPQAFALMKLLRGKIAAYNMHLRAIADARDCYLVDLWSMRFLRHASAWSEDRLHLTSDSHRRVALRASEVLGIPVTQDWRTAVDGTARDGTARDGTGADGSPLPAVLSGAVASGTGGNAPGGPVGAPVVAAPGAARAAWVQARKGDVQWAKQHFVPWINRRLHGTSSGDGLPPKRPELQPVAPAPGAPAGALRTCETAPAGAVSRAIQASESRRAARNDRSTGLAVRALAAS
jgi:lysophospholipase L1-like esterase